MIKLLLAIYLSLYPQLGQSCSCVGFSDRHETLRDGICWGEVYSGVVVGATCSCVLRDSVTDDIIDCREYSYSMSDDSYASRVLTRVELNTNNVNPFFEEYLKTCMQAGSILSPDVRIPLDTESVPDVVTRNISDYGALVCPFNNEDSSPEAGVCVYSVRVTEVFIGNNISVGDVITSSGPDTLTSCAAVYGGILELNTEYLAGVGGPCSSFFNDWEPLSVYSEGDLKDLRGFAEDVREDGEEARCGSVTVYGLSVVSMTAIVAVLVLATG